MADDAAIRRANLVRLLKTPENAHKLMPTRRYTYWRDLMRDPRKSFGEKVARDIEGQMGWPRNALDQPDFDPADSTPMTGPLHGADWRAAAELVAKRVPDPVKREQLLNFIRYVDLYLEQGERIAASIPDIA